MDIRLVPCPPWQAFIEGSIYPDAEVPWCDDPAFALLQGIARPAGQYQRRITVALTQTMGTSRGPT